MCGDVYNASNRPLTVAASIFIDRSSDNTIGGTAVGAATLDRATADDRRQH